MNTAISLRVKLILLFLFLSFDTFSQNKKYEILGKVDVENGTTAGLKVTIFENAKKITTSSIGRNGKFQYKLDFGNDYMLVFNKEGFVTKKVSISTFVPPEILEQNSKFPPLHFKVMLFPAYEGVDLSIFNQPTGMIMYDKELDDFAYDKDYDKQIRDAIKKAERETREKAKELAEKEKKKERAYKEAIKKGDVYFKDKKYDLAKLGYEDALSIKPNAEYPKNQTLEIEKILTDKAEQLAKQKVLNEKYQTFITQADKEFQTEDYTNAKSNYQAALEVKPNEKYPQNQIIKIDDILKKKAKQLAKQKIIDRKYQQIIEEADKAFNTKKYTVAKTNYQSAIELKNNELYPQNQITKIDKILADKAQKLAEQKALEEKYQQLIADADKTFNAKNYTNAEAIYQSALNIKPNEEYPQNQLKKIENRLTEQAQQLAEQKAIQEKYQEIISKADKEFQEKKYTEAKTDYLAALEVKAKEEYPQKQIEKIEAIWENQRETDKKYNKIIKSADKKFRKKKYESAKIDFNAALALKPEATYPKTQLEKIEAFLLQQEKEKAALQQLALQKQQQEEAFNQLIKEGDDLFNNKKYTEAKAIYLKGLETHKDNIYLKKQIAQIETQLSIQLRVEKLQKEKNERYNMLIKKADEYYEREIYKTATARYKMALKLKPEATYPQEQIDKINAFYEEQKKLDKIYRELIKNADQNYAKKKYNLAKAGYKKALSTKPSAEYPREMIAKIDTYHLGELHKYAESKMNDIRYKELKVIADNQFDEKQYEEAKKTYKNMLEIKPQSKYPKEQIAQIDAIFATRQRKIEASLRLAKEKQEDEKQYKLMIANGDRLFKDKLWEEAIAYYQKAVAQRPEDNYPKEQIKKAKKEIARINSIKENFEAKEKKYNELITSGDKHFSEKDFRNAKIIYNKAIEIKKDAEYPKNQLRRMAIIEETQAKEKEKQFKIQNEYNEEIAKADKFFEKEKLVIARHHYQAAIKIKPDETYPKKQLKEIDKLIEILKNPEKLNKARLAKREKDYSILIKKGDNNFEAKHYTVAKIMYKRALKLFQREYPKQQLDEITKLVKEGRIALLTEAYEEAITKGDNALNNNEYGVAKFYYRKAMAMAKNEDYPRQQLKEIKLRLKEEKETEKQIAYNKAIKKADKNLKQGDKGMARFYYKKALRLQPKADYPVQQLKALNSN